MLTDSKIKASKATGKPYKLTDSNRFYVHISAIGTKTFRQDYTFDGKQKTFIIGNYPDISLADAREKANELRKQAKRGIDPNLQTSKRYAFRAIAEEYCELKGWDAKHKQVRRLEIYVYPSIGNANINQIMPPDILAIIRPIERQGTGETAHRTLNVVGQVYRYAISCGYAEIDRTYGLSKALKPVQDGHYQAVTDAEGFKALYKSLDNIFSIVTRNALKMAALTAVRPGELRTMQWADIDLDKALWSYTVTKTRTEHLVPLSSQAMAILMEMRGLTGKHKYVFVSLRDSDKDRPLSNTAMLMALQRIGVDSTVHGFRASFRTIMDEQLNYPPHLLEHQLAHSVRDTLGRSYNRTQHLKERVEMMKAWGNFLN